MIFNSAGSPFQFGNCYNGPRMLARHSNRSQDKQWLLWTISLRRQLCTFNNKLRMKFRFWQPSRCNRFGYLSMMLSPRRGKRPKFWPWPRPRRRPRGFGLGLASISLSYVIGHFSCKNRVKFGNLVNFSGNKLKSHVVIVNHYLVFFIIIFGLA